MPQLKILYDKTEDNLKLMGCLYESNSKESCVVMIHGMNGSIIESEFANVWGNILSQNEISFLYGHTRGYSYINKIPCQNGEQKICGTTFEIFEESFYDVDLWVKKAKELGYKKIILLGHSLGCNKVIYYLSKKGNAVDGLILASPPDIIGLIKNDTYQPDYQDLIDEATLNIKVGNPTKILSKKLWDEHIISSQTLLDYTKEESAIDNLPVKRNPVHFKELEMIKIPTLAFMGSNDDIVINSIEEDLKLIKEKAKACSDFTTVIFKDTNHYYNQKEIEIGNYMNTWIQKNILGKELIENSLNT